jgi:hypothetical protein
MTDSHQHADFFWIIFWIIAFAAAMLILAAALWLR